MIIEKKPCPEGTRNATRDPQTIFVPQELVDATIDYLQDDPTSLQNCSFVCVSMLQRCTKHLFRRVSVSTTRLLDCIACLRTSSRLPRSILDFTILGDKLTYIMPVHIHTVMMLLPCVESIRFGGLFRSFAPRPALPLPIARRKLSTLYFDFIHLDLIECVLEMFTMVEMVVLDGPYVEGSVNQPRNAGPVRFLRLRTRPLWICTVLRVFQPSLLTHVTIDFYDEHIANPHELERFLQTYGWNLEHFALAAPVASLILTHFLRALESCKELVSVTLTIPGPQKNVDVPSITYHWPLVHPHDVGHGMHISLRTDKNWNDSDWQGLNGTLEQHVYLARFNIDCAAGASRSPLSPEIQNHIRTLLSPRLSKIICFR